MRIRRVSEEVALLEAGDRLLSAVPAALRPAVHGLLGDPRRGGRGLRAWVGRLEAGARPLPPMVPRELIEVYLSDADAEPLHDCGECGLSVPVRAGRRAGHEPSCDRVYFAACPHCGGRTGPHAYWSRAAHTHVN